MYLSFCCCWLLIITKPGHCCNSVFSYPTLCFKINNHQQSLFSIKIDIPWLTDRNMLLAQRFSVPFLLEASKALPFDSVLVSLHAFLICQMSLILDLFYWETQITNTNQHLCYVLSLSLSLTLTLSLSLSLSLSFSLQHTHMHAQAHTRTHRLLNYQDGVRFTQDICKPDKDNRTNVTKRNQYWFQNHLVTTLRLVYQMCRHM